MTIKHSCIALWLLCSIINTHAAKSIKCFELVREIYRNDDAFVSDATMYRLRTNNFIDSRSLSHYETSFGNSFLRDLNALGPEDHWIDSGTGEAVAPLMYLGEIENHHYEVTRIALGLEDQTRARVTGISYARPDYIPTTDNNWKAILTDKGDHQFRYLEGQLLENIPPDKLETAQLITDFFGPLAYTKAPDIVLQKYLDILSRDGSIYFHGVHKTLVDEKHFVHWLKSIDGIKVEELGFCAIRITKTTDERIVVPKLYSLSYEDGGPPFRDLSTQPNK